MASEPLRKLFEDKKKELKTSWIDKNSPGLVLSKLFESNEALGEEEKLVPDTRISKHNTLGNAKAERDGAKWGERQNHYNQLIHNKSMLRSLHITKHINKK